MTIASSLLPCREHRRRSERVNEYRHSRCIDAKVAHRWNASLAYLQRPFRAGLYENENVMKRDKSHRVVIADFGECVAAMQASVAVERAENEGWPIIPLAMEEPPSVARTGVVRRAAKHVANHFHNEYRFWSGHPAGSARRVTH